jgi:hypothetical protein
MEGVRYNSPVNFFLLHSNLQEGSMKHFSRVSSRWVLGLAVLALLAFMVGCSDTNESLNAPTGGEQQSVLLSKSNPKVQVVMAVQDRYTPELMEDPLVVGTATGLGDNGEPAIIVYLESDRGGKRVPDSIEGIQVVKVVSGKIRMLRGSSSGHTARYPRPIELGVSGGNSKDFAYPYCCSGTLGALVTDGSKQYILSNGHVFAGDQAASANDPDVAEVGQEINQPGLIDVNCQDIPDDYVAYLTAWCEDGYNVDCSVAEVIPGMVDPEGSILEIGEISATTLDAYVGLEIKKSGRTTGLTRGSVSSINGNFNVGGTDECGGEETVEYFTDQIVISGRRISGAGDSGSLVVEDVDTNPRAVALLFAGSGNMALCNPIDDVLAYFGISLVGN